MVKVVGVRFRTAGKIYYFDPANHVIEAGMYVIVETARGVEFGEVAFGIREVPENDIVAPLKCVIRIADENDMKINEENKEKEKKAPEIWNEKVIEHNLQMKLIDVEYTFDNNKVLFYYTAEGRVDFRELVKDLAAIFKTRIELRQIGVRDESKMIGGLGICGRCLCCKGFLGEFQPVSIKMAKEQGLSLNPTKISGTCGRLMCCLKYEQDVYEDALSRMPKMGAIVETEFGQGTVMEVNLLKEFVKIKLDKGSETDLKILKPNEIKVIKDVTWDDDLGADFETLKQLEGN